MDLACGFRARAGLETDAGCRVSEARCQMVDRGSASPPPAGNEVGSVKTAQLSKPDLLMCDK